MLFSTPKVDIDSRRKVDSRSKPSMTTVAGAGDDAGDAGPGGDEPAEKAEGAPLDRLSARQTELGLSA